MGMLSDAMKKGAEKKEKKAFSSPEQFWESWVNADELQKIRLVNTLSIFDMMKEPEMKRAFVSLVNSYLVDLHEYMADKMRYMTSDARQKSSVEENRYGSGKSGDDDLSQLQP